MARVSQLYEQGAAASRIGAYLRRWERWVQAGLGGMRVEMGRMSLRKMCHYKT